MKTLHLRWMAAALTAAVCFTVFLAAQTHPAQAQAINCADTAATGIPQSECAALVAVFPDRTENVSPCQWGEVTCTGGYVTGLDFTETGIGTTMPDLSALTHLETLIVFRCGLSGEFPAWIANSATLKIVDLTENFFSGPLPDLSAMTSLEYLNISRNSFSGAFPDISSLTSLQELHIADNQFTGPLPDVSMLPNLKILWAISNNFTGTIHSGITNSTSLEWILLHYNDLSGPLPDLRSMTALVHFNASNNDLVGDLPSPPPFPPGITMIALSSNHFTGSIPASYTELPLLEGLILDGNMLTGEVPSTYEGDLGYLAFNALTANAPLIPSEWFDRTQTIPPTGIGASNVTHNSANVSWTPIAYTDGAGSYQVGLSMTSGSGYVFGHSTANKSASGVALSGLIPNTTYYAVVRTVTQPYADNPNTVTSLNSAEFSFTTGFDPNVVNCADTATTGIPQAECEILMAEIAPVVPEWERNQPPCTWTVVYCVNNHVTGISMYNDDIHVGPHIYELLAVPDLSGLTQLLDLSLQNVGLTGPVPAWIAESSTLQLVNLSSNELSGTIPDLSGMTSLYALTFRDNNLEGALPAIPPNLEALHLSNNRLSGNIPSSYANLIGGLELNGNKLTGEVPAEFVDTINGMPMTPDLNYNALTAAAPGLVELLNQSDPQFSLTQTVPPTGIAVSNVTHDSATLAWTPIAFTDHAGAYEVGLSTTSGSGYMFSHSTANKSASGITASSLMPNTTYYAVVRTVTQPHDNDYFRLANPNTVTSPNSAEFSFTTGFDPSVLNCADTAATGIPQAECEALVSEIYPLVAEAEQDSLPCEVSGISCENGHVTSIYTTARAHLATAIPELSALTHLENFQFHCPCTGSFPAWIAASPILKIVGISNQLSGTVPDLSAMVSLEVLTLSGNQFSGPLPDISALPNLQVLSLAGNNFSGTLHSGITASNSLEHLNVMSNALSGALPDMSGMASLTTFYAADNQFAGSLPEFPPNIVEIILSVNSLTGQIPASYGDLPLSDLLLSGNMLYGEVPSTLQNLSLDLSFNALTATNPAAIAWLTNPLNGASDFFETQTIPPTGFVVGNITSMNADLSWTPISYTAHEGAYEIGLSTTSGGGYIFSHVTADKQASGITLTGLSPNTTYYAVIRTITQPHEEELQPNNIPEWSRLDNHNTVTSLNSAEFSFTTLVDPVSPPVLLSPATNGVVRGTNSPVLSWLPNPAGEGVTTYRVLLKNDATGATVLKQNVPAATCAAVCTVDLGALVPQVDLALGVYNWQVTATGSLGATRSLKQRFSVVRPDAPVITAPLGMISDPQPDLMWTVNPDDLNTRYKLKLAGVKSGVVIKKTVIGVCSGAACTVALDTLAGGPYLLDNDTYTLTITAVNDIGGRTGSSTFRMKFPAPAVNLTPSGGTVVNTQSPVLSWMPDPNASSFRVILQRIKNGAVVKVYKVNNIVNGTQGFVCGAGTCTLDLAALESPLALPKGNYAWAVISSSPAIHPTSSSKSAKAKFKIVLP
jgi:Leucine-rich repeat (LRR) protein